MVKLSAELIQNCHQRTNPVRDRELDLRGYKIPVIENMGATLTMTSGNWIISRCSLDLKVS